MAPSSFFTDSPTAVLPPSQGPDQYFHSAYYRPVENASNVATPYEAFSNLSTRSQPPTPSEGSIAGRKRSRNDIYSPEDEHAIIQDQPAPVPANRGEPTYGPGMTLIYPSDPSGHYTMEAGSQSGTWVEARVQDTDPASATSRRPIMASRKSQRMDSGARVSDDAVSAMPQSAPRALIASEPIRDAATKLLGVSWVRMDATDGLAIAQRAYTRWVSRHYPFLSDVEIWFENSAIPGYLGRATNRNNGLQEYYLWSHDLHQAILVTRNPSDLVLKLSQPHMSLSQCCDRIKADLEPVVSASAANRAILHNDRYIIDDDPEPEMDLS